MKKSILFVASLILMLSAVLQNNLIFGNGRQVSANAYKTDGYIYNAVVYISFAQEGGVESEGFLSYDEHFFEKMERMYNSSKLSVKNYFLTQSNGKLTVETKFFGENDPIILDNTAEYYKPRYEWKDGKYSIAENIDGYDNRWYDADGKLVEPGSKNAKESIDGYLREQQLVREVAAKCNVGDYDGDYDKNGKTDSLVFVVDAGNNNHSSSGWGEVLWSHMGVAHGFPQSVLNNYYYTQEQSDIATNLNNAVFGESTISKYNFLSAAEICKRQTGNYSAAVKGTEDGELYDIGLLCHEMAHNLGLSDYYSYERPNYESVGEFDILGNYTPVPQNMLAYVRFKMGWIDFDDILYVNSSGEYTLPFSSNNGYACAKIVLNDYLSTGEYFILEARSKDYSTVDNPFDSCLSGSGLIIYRVSEKNAYINSKGTLGNTDYGNMFGDDEVYVYRVNALDGTNNKLTQKVLLVVEHSTALLGDSVSSCSVQRFGSKEFTAENLINYSDGITNSSIVIDGITENQEKVEAAGMTFNVSLPDEPKSEVITLDMSQCRIGSHFDGRRKLLWSSNIKDGKAYVFALRTTDRLKRLAETNKANITIEDIKNGKFSYYKTLYKGSAPLAEKGLILPEFEDDAMIFLALESSSGLRTIRYAGEISIEEETIAQYFARIFDPIYIFVIVAAVLLLIVVIVLLITSKKSLKRIE